MLKFLNVVKYVFDYDYFSEILKRLRLNEMIKEIQFVLRRKIYLYFLFAMN